MLAIPTGLCPGYSVPMAAQLMASQGRLDAPLAIMNVTAIVQTGSLFITYTDFAANMLYQSFAQPPGASGPFNAYDRNFVAVNMTALFALSPPAL